MRAPATDVAAAVTAAGNNADRVDEVVRATGTVTHRDARRWWAEARTPPFHPDAVTLVAGLGADEVLAGIDAGPGGSVKDSFADVDLTAHGFDVLIEGSWLRCDAAPAAPGPLGWHWVDVGGVETASVDGTIVASCTLTRSATVIGVTNVDADGVDPVLVWGELLALAAERAPATPVVAWDPVEHVPHAVAAGFRVVGPLRVWARA